MGLVFYQHAPHWGRHRAKRRGAAAPAAIAPDHWRTTSHDLKALEEGCWKPKPLGFVVPKTKIELVIKSEVHHCFKTYNYSLNKMIQKEGKKNRKRKKTSGMQGLVFLYFKSAIWKHCNMTNSAKMFSWPQRLAFRQTQGLCQFLEEWASVVFFNTRTCLLFFSLLISLILGIPFLMFLLFIGSLFKRVLDVTFSSGC